MKVPVRNAETSFAVTVPDNASVHDLMIAVYLSLPSEPSVANLSISSPNDINLWYGGRKMDHSLLLSSYGISPLSLQNENFIIHLTTVVANNNATLIDDAQSPSSSSNESPITPPSSVKKSSKSSKSKSSKSKSKKCHFDHCTSNQLRMVGDCQFCQGKFCSKHRLLENHNCSGLKVCKDKSYERNALKLQSEQIVTSKV